MTRKKNSPSKAKTPPKAKGKQEGATPSKASTSSKESHVLGSDADLISEMYANGLRILRDPCPVCGTECEAGDKFEYAAVCPLTYKNVPMTGCIYIVGCEDLRYRKQTTYISKGQILPMMVMSWEKEAPPAGREHEDPPWMRLPEGNPDLLTPGKHDVVVLAVQNCQCSLLTAFNTGVMTVYNAGDVEAWSTSDLSDIEESKPWAAAVFQRHYKAYVREPESDAKKKKNKNLTAAARDLEDDEEEVKQNPLRAMLPKKVERKDSKFSMKSADEGFVTGGGTGTDGNESDDVVPPSPRVLRNKTVVITPSKVKKVSPAKQEKQKSTPVKEKPTPKKTPVEEIPTPKKTPVKEKPTPKKAPVKEKLTPRDTKAEDFSIEPHSGKKSKQVAAHFQKVTVRPGKEDKVEDMEVSYDEEEEEEEEQHPPIDIDEDDEEDQEARTMPPDEDEEEDSESEDGEVGEGDGVEDGEDGEGDGVQYEEEGEGQQSGSEDGEGESGGSHVSASEDEGGEGDGDEGINVFDFGDDVGVIGDLDEFPDECPELPQEKRPPRIFNMDNKVEYVIVDGNDEDPVPSSSSQNVRATKPSDYNMTWLTDPEQRKKAEQEMFEYENPQHPSVIFKVKKEVVEVDKKKKKKVEVESEEEEDEENKEEVEVEKKKKKVEVGKKKKKKVESEEEEEEDDENKEQENENEEEESDDGEGDGENKGEESDDESSDANEVIDLGSDHDESWTVDMDGLSDYQLRRRRLDKVAATAKAQLDKDLAQFQFSKTALSKQKREVIEQKMRILQKLMEEPNMKPERMDFVIDKICNNKFDELEAVEPDEPLEPAKSPEPEPMVKDGEWNPEAAPGAFEAAGEMMPVTPRKRVRRVHGHEVLEEVSADLDFEVPESAFLTKQEQEKAIQANAKEEKRRKKLKQEVDKKTRQLMLNLEECVHIYNNNDGKMPRIEQKTMTEKVEKLMEIAGEALSGSDIQEAYDTVNALIAQLDGIFQLVKVQQQNYIDLGTRFALQRLTIRTLQNQMAVSAAVLRKRSAHLVMDGADLDPNGPLFGSALEALAESGFQTEEAYDGHKAEEVQSTIYNYVNLTKAHKRIGNLETQPFPVYPKLALDMADEWKGDPVLPLDEDYCNKRIEGQSPCHVVINDPRILNPKTKQYGMQYRWCGENVWISLTLMEVIWRGMCACPLKIGMPKNERELQSAWSSYKPIAEAIVNALFIGGVMGTELANYYVTSPNPLTAKKVRIARNIVKFFVNHMVQAGTGNTKDYERVPQHVESAIGRLANRQRVDRTAVLSEDGRTVLVKGKTSSGSWLYKKPGTPFFKHINEKKNADDDYVRDFIEHPSIGNDPEFLEVMNKIRRPGGGEGGGGRGKKKNRKNKKKEEEVAEIVEEDVEEEEDEESSDDEGPKQPPPRGKGRPAGTGKGKGGKGGKKKGGKKKGRKGKGKKGKGGKGKGKTEEVTTEEEEEDQAAEEEEAVATDESQETEGSGDEEQEEEAPPPPKKPETKVKRRTWVRKIPDHLQIKVEPIPPLAQLPPPTVNELKAMEQADRVHRSKLTHNRLLFENRQKSKKYAEKQGQKPAPTPKVDDGTPAPNVKPASAPRVGAATPVRDVQAAKRGAQSAPGNRGPRKLNGDETSAQPAAVAASSKPKTVDKAAAPKKTTTTAAAAGPKKPPTAAAAGPKKPQTAAAAPAAKKKVVAEFDFLSQPQPKPKVAAAAAQKKKTMTTTAAAPPAPNRPRPRNTACPPTPPPPATNRPRPRNTACPPTPPPAATQGSSKGAKRPLSPTPSNATQGSTDSVSASSKRMMLWKRQHEHYSMALSTWTRKKAAGLPVGLKPQPSNFGLHPQGTFHLSPPKGITITRQTKEEPQKKKVKK